MPHYLPLDGLARSKQDPINRGQGAQYLYRPPPAGANLEYSPAQNLSACTSKWGRQHCLGHTAMLLSHAGRPVVEIRCGLHQKGGFISDPSNKRKIGACHYASQDSSPEPGGWIEWWRAEQKECSSWTVLWHQTQSLRLAKETRKYENIKRPLPVLATPCQEVQIFLEETIQQ